MIFRRKNKNTPQKLADIVERKYDTGYIFWNVVDDLGDCVEAIMASSKQTIMAYAYARRLAVASLYIQGLVKKDGFDHAVSIFKALQIQTEHSVEFQEAAATDAIDYMHSYTVMINKLLACKIIDIAMNYDIPDGRMSDGQLFESVIDTFHKEEQAIKVGTFRNSKGEIVPITDRKIEGSSRSLDGPEYRNQLHKFHSLLYEISERPSQKTCEFVVMPCDGSSWSWHFEFSDEEEEEANEVISKIYDYAQGWIQSSTIPIFKSVDRNDDDLEIPF